MENQRAKQKGYQQGIQKMREEFEAGGFMAHKGQWNIAKKRMLED